MHMARTPAHSITVYVVAPVAVGCQIPCGGCACALRLLLAVAPSAATLHTAVCRPGHIMANGDGSVAADVKRVLTLWLRLPDVSLWLLTVAGWWLSWCCCMCCGGSSVGGDPSVLPRLQMPLLVLGLEFCSCRRQLEGVLSVAWVPVPPLV